MSRKKKRKTASTSANQQVKPAPPRDSVHDFADNLIFSGTLLVLFLRPFISGRTYPIHNHFFNISIAVLALLWLVKAWRKGALVLHNRLLTCFLLGFFAVCGFTFFTTINKGLTLRYIYEILAYTLLFLVIANNFRDMSKIKAGVVVFLAAGFLVNLYGVGQQFYTLEMTRQYVEQALKTADTQSFSGIPIGTGVLHRLETQRIFSTFLHPNSYALYLAILGALTLGWTWDSRRFLTESARRSVSLILRRSNLSGRHGTLSAFLSVAAGTGEILLLVLFLISCIIIPFCLWLTYSRGGLLSAAAVLVVFAAVWVWGRRAPKTVVAGVALAAVVSLLFLHMPDAYCADKIDVKSVSFMSRLQDSLSVKQRLSYWEATLIMIRDYPWVGVGWGAWESAYPKYMVLGGYPVRLAHNNFLQVCAETGIIGLNLFVGLWLVSLHAFWRKLRSSEMQGIACGLGAAIVAFLVNSMVDFALYLPALVSVVFACLGLLAAIPADDDEHDKFSISLTTPRALVLGLFLLCFVFLLYQSFAALKVFDDVERKRADAFPNAFAQSRGFQSNPHLQYQVLRSSIPRLNQSISRYPFSSDSYQLLGEIYLRLAGLEQSPHLITEAIKCFERAAELNPLSPYVRRSLATAYWTNGNITQQSAFFEKALLAEVKASENFPVNPEFHTDLVTIYTALGHVDKAGKEAELAAELAKHYKQF
ncbi:MAG: hypothetical protein C4520_05080 [Candidatus Abyssobacteria bacterium SURF_5]|uniref:O-antigen ligase-related domain-containing protein n=1 Tax=Abyssobacteria bacterium (strain SURF_5) TaxID=2093360 RepID=A0A3A4NUF1_ABYX5|nr:MAG: hypothetical protein C4520_05080 [Candidatus Abyssubacteria bacterium SURF_5]